MLAVTDVRHWVYRIGKKFFRLNALFFAIGIVTVLDLVSQVCDIVLMSVYLDLENPRGAGFWNEGVYEQGEGNGKFSL
jgi:hypothetical protein